MCLLALDKLNKKFSFSISMFPSCLKKVMEIDVDDRNVCRYGPIFPVHPEWPERLMLVNLTSKGGKKGKGE